MLSGHGLTLFWNLPPAFASNLMTANTFLDTRSQTEHFFGLESRRARFVLLQQSSMKVGVFIERDGVLNQAQLDRQHQVSPLTLEEFRVHKTAKALLQKLKAAGLVLIATTNQPGLSRGYLSRRVLERMHDLLRRELPLDDIMVCPHDETDDCPCRKPQPGLLIEAAFKWHLDLDRSFVISDKWQDVGAARAAGSTSLHIQSPWPTSVHPDLVLPSFATAVGKLLQLQASSRPLFA